MKNTSSKYVYLFVALILILTTWACGSSTTEKLEEAVAPTSASEVEEVADGVQPDVQETEPESTKPQSTDIPEPTDAPPTPTPEPTEPPPTPTPEPEPIVVIAQGFGQDGRSVGYSFIVENPNAGLAFEDSQYQIAAFDESGAIVDTDSGFITLLLPEQTLGVGNSLFVDEGVVVSSIEIQLNAGDPQVTDPIPNFTVDRPTYHASDFFSDVTGIIQSPYNRDFSDLRVSAVVYNEADEIIGGGFTFVNFVLANNSTGVNVSVTSAGEVARAELYPVLSGLSLLGSENEIPKDATNISLINQGYGQDDRSGGYGLIIENPNSAYSIENSQYRITFFAEDDTVIETEEGYIDLVLPEQTLGIGGEVFLSEGQTINRMEAQLQVGDYIEATEELPQFSSENITFSQGSYSSQVTGFIVNPYTQDVTNLRVSTIAYNESGEIIGGGFTFLDFAAANSKSAVEVSITTSGVPTTVELYAVPTSLTEFE